MLHIDIVRRPWLDCELQRPAGMTHHLALLPSLPQESTWHPGACSPRLTPDGLWLFASVQGVKLTFPAMSGRWISELDGGQGRVRAGPGRWEEGGASYHTSHAPLLRVTKIDPGQNTNWPCGFLCCRLFRMSVHFASVCPGGGRIGEVWTHTDAGFNPNPQLAGSVTPIL